MTDAPSIYYTMREGGNAMFGCQQVPIESDLELKAILEYIGSEANKLHNCAVYYARQIYFKTHGCLDNQIGTVVFGWNQGMKDRSNLGHKTNQNFVQIPTARLKERIQQLCEVYTIQFIETEESYTSKASFVDADLLPSIGEKPDGWQASGKRTKRGLYRTANNWYINADCNGAANIIRKVSTTLGFDLSRVSRGVLTRPQKLKIWSAKQHCVASL